MLSKRNLLQALIGAAALSVAGGATASIFADPAVDAAGVAEIGRAWLAQHPAKAEALRSRLFPRGADPADLPRLADQIRRDFANEALFVHKGWHISATEARLCALLALS